MSALGQQTYAVQIAMTTLPQQRPRKRTLSKGYVRFTPESGHLSGSDAKLGRIPSRTLSHEPENLHDNSQRDLWSSSVVPCVTNFPWLAGRNRRLDGADVVKLDRSRSRRRLELLRNKARHAWLTQKTDRATH